MRTALFFLLLGFAFYACNSNRTDESSSNDPLTKKSLNQSEGLVNPDYVVTNVQEFGPTEFGDRVMVKLTPYIPEYSGFSETEQNLLSSRLNAAVAEVGYGGEGGDPRFIIGPVVNILSSQLTNGAPTLYSITYEINFLVADIIEETIFASYTTQFKGVGESGVKAFVNGFRNTNLKTPEFYHFLKNAEIKIDEYYKENCDKILLQAQAETDDRNYEMAYLILKNIPLENTDCFVKAQSQRKTVFNEMLKEKCNELLMQMKSELGKLNDESASGYNEEAMALFALIDPGSSCYSDAQKIYDNYVKGLKPVQKRDWDQKKMEYERLQKQADLNTAIKRDSIEQAFSFQLKNMELAKSAEAISNKILLEKYQKDHYYERLPWFRKIFHLGDLDPFDGYSEGSI